MKKIKCIVGIVFVLICSGCMSNDDYVDINSVDYYLDISDSYKEDIKFNLKKNAYDIAKEDNESDKTFISLEYRLLNDDQTAVFGDSYFKYDKKIKKHSNSVSVQLAYNYIEDEFIYNNYIMTCFDNYLIDSKDDYLEVKLNGEFKCFYNNDLKSIRINVKSNHLVDSNGTYEDGYYKWDINRSNYKNVNVYFRISRDFDDMAREIVDNNDSRKQMSGVIKLVVVILLVVVTIISIIKIKRKNNEV